MSETQKIDPARSALLIMDYQTSIIGLLDDASSVLKAAEATLAAARKAGILVIYIVVGFRPGHPEISPRNKMFSAIKNANWLVTESAGTDIDAAVMPLESDIILLKHRVGAFTGTALDTILRTHNVDTLLLCGLSTSGVVLSTVRHAADCDYQIVVVEDACADPDAEVQQCLMKKVFPRQATVITSVALVAAIESQ